MSQKSEAKVGLSIYLVGFLHISNIIQQLFGRCSALIGVDDALSTGVDDLNGICSALLQRGNDLFGFLRFQYCHT